jgi:hypothetical protein
LSKGSSRFVSRKAAQQVGGPAGWQRHHHRNGPGRKAPLRLRSIGCHPNEGGENYTDDVVSHLARSHLEQTRNAIERKTVRHPGTKVLNETAISFDRSVVIAHNEAIVNRFGIAPLSIKTLPLLPCTSCLTRRDLRRSNFSGRTHC